MEFSQFPSRNKELLLDALEHYSTFCHTQIIRFKGVDDAAVKRWRDDLDTCDAMIDSLGPSEPEPEIS